MMLLERPKCPVHKKDMVPWQFRAKTQGVVTGFKCTEPDCKVLYSDEIKDVYGFFTLTLDGEPIPFVIRA